MTVPTCGIVASITIVSERSTRFSAPGADRECARRPATCVGDARTARIRQDREDSRSACSADRDLRAAVPRDGAREALLEGDDRLIAEDAAGLRNVGLGILD